MANLFTNFLGGSITDNPLSSSATTISSAAFQNLPQVTSPDFMYLVLDPDGTAGAPEIVKVTAHTSGTSSITAVRAQQLTGARTHNAGTVWRHTATAADLNVFQAGTSGLLRLHATRLTDQTISGSGTTAAISWTAADVNTDFFLVGTNTVLTTPSGMGGIYMLVVRVYCISAVTGASINASGVKPLVNGGNPATAWPSTPAGFGAGTDGVFSGLLHLNSSDSFVVNVTTNATAGSVNVRAEAWLFRML